MDNYSLYNHVLLDMLDTTILDKEIGSNHRGQIAELMAEWEGRIADELNLTDTDVAGIKHQYPRELKLQL